MSEAWRFTQQISRRPSVRVAVTDSHGNVLNSYERRHPLHRSVPEVPWAINLADTAGRFHFIVCDLDVSRDSAAAVRSDCDTLTGWLTDIGIPHVVCVSGPSGGRHVWVALAEPMRSETVAMLAAALSRRLATLDTSPLMNPVTGAVRPPGAPHRHGGHSEILSGHPRTLTHPFALSEPIERWTALMAAEDLAADMAAIGETSQHTGARTVVKDEQGVSHIAGQRRPLTAAIRATVDTPVTPETDASATLMRVLVAAAAASWTLTDVRELLDAPGLEALRTRRDGGHRVLRPSRGNQSTEAMLRRQWLRAVSFVASTPTLRGNDVDFDDRAAAITALIARVQTRADAMPGRWAAGAGPTMRRVLDALSVLALQGVTAIVEADQRRLALMCGIGVQTARRSLGRLAEEGWIVLDQAAEGVRAHRWKIAPQDVFHRIPASGGPQGTPPPAGVTRHSLLVTLTHRISLAAHDVFTPGGLGHHAGNVFSRIPERTREEDSVTHLVLARSGLITRESDCWTLTHVETRNLVAMWHGCSGVLAERESRIADERELWAWWQAELAWRCAPRPKKRPPAYMSLFVLTPCESVYGAHPRHGKGRADFCEARRLLRKPTILADKLGELYRQHFTTES